MIRRPPSSPLFPSPPLFRSRAAIEIVVAVEDHILGPLDAAEPDHRYVAQLVVDGPGRAAIRCSRGGREHVVDRKSTRLNSSHLVISYAVFCLKKKNPLDVLAAKVAAAHACPERVGVRGH